MGAPGYFIAAGLFMIAAAILWGIGIAVPDYRARDLPQIAAVLVVVLVLFLLAKGVQEQKKDGK